MCNGDREHMCVCVSMGGATFFLSFVVSQSLPLCPIHHLIGGQKYFCLKHISLFSRPTSWVRSMIIIIIIVIIIIIIINNYNNYNDYNLPTNFLGPLDDAFDLIPSSIFSHTRGTPTVRVGLRKIFHHQYDLICGAPEYVR